MNYRVDKYGNEISLLGFGCMRLPGKAGIINKAAAEEQIMAAINAGINYFDTAYIYPGSEAVLGEILEKNNVRDKVNIATKLPHYILKSKEAAEKIFYEELRRLRTDHIDYYLMHMLGDVAAWEKLKALGVVEWLEEKKASGEIKQLGFSYHGNSDMFCKLIDAYDWDFCLIQYNYMDEHSQAGRKGLQYANLNGLPVFIMEPLRGGKLVNMLPEEAKTLFAAADKQFTPAQWAFKWLYNQPEVTCVLSGMNSMEMLMENIETASATKVGDLTWEDEQLLVRVANAINAKMKVGCTGCGYCTTCPAGVDIPGCFSAYNRRYTESKFWGLVDYTINTALRKESSAASKCIGCGKCNKKCPQGLNVQDELKKVSIEMEKLPYKAVRKVVETFKLFG